jgi:imidazoleglycerol phosphate dehydratase HisB
MLELKRKTKEVDITIKYSDSIGGKVKVDILGEGDFSHHLIEELFGLIDKLARMETVGHQSSEWRR